MRSDELLPIAASSPGWALRLQLNGDSRDKSIQGLVFLWLRKRVNSLSVAGARLAFVPHFSSASCKWLPGGGRTGAANIILSIFDDTSQGENRCLVGEIFVVGSGMDHAVILQGFQVADDFRPHGQFPLDSFLDPSGQGVGGLEQRCPGE